MRLFSFLLSLCLILSPCAVDAFPHGGLGVPPPVGSLILPGTPVAVYSTLKYANWAGPALRIQRISDNTQQDIGFGTNNYIDMSAVNSFCTSTICKVIVWYDESGSANDAISTGTPPILTSLNSVNGVQPINFVTATGNAAAANLSIPASLTVSRQSYTAYSALAFQGGLFNSTSPFGLGVDSTPTNNVTAVYDNTHGGDARWLDGSFHNTTSFAQVAQASILGIKSDGVTVRFRYNGVESTATASSATSMVGGNIGKGSWAMAPFFAGDMFALVIYATSVSAGDSTSIEGTLATAFNSTFHPARQILFDGDSITAGFIATDFMRNLTRQTFPLLTKQAGIYNIGVSGTTMAAIYAGRANAIIHYNGAILQNILHIFAGTNDISTTPSGSIVGVGTTIFNNYLIPYVQAMQTAGYTQTVVGTMLPRLWTGSATDIAQKETERLNYNNLITTNAALYGYAVADYASLYTSNPTAYTTGGGSVDGIHPTITTYGNMAVICAAVLNPLLAFNASNDNLFAANDNISGTTLRKNIYR